MKINYKPFELNLRHPFTIAKFSRTSTPIMLMEISYEGFTGFGEASMVPYMGESIETANAFMAKVDLSWLKPPFALHDLQGKIEQRACYKYFGTDPSKMPPTSYTLGIDTPEVLIRKIKEGENCHIIKVKLGRDNDKELINTIRSVSDKPLYVDANQGWTDRQQGLDMVLWLHEQGVVLIEQPMAKDDPDSNAWITERSPVAIVGDESVQRFADVEKAKGVYHGINMKLMKSAGMHEGYRIIMKAKELGLKTMIGCMSETSCGTLAAAALAPLCDWADLDGPFLTSNNPYKDPEFKDGKWILSDIPGLGLIKP